MDVLPLEVRLTLKRVR